MTTELVFILDRSGSMSGLERDTIGGFNSMIDKQKKEDGEAVVSTALFDNESVVIHDRLPLDKVPRMTEKEYFTRGCTALLDAVGGAIHHIGNIHKYSRKEDVPEKTLFIITTDGYENASKRYDYETVRKMIEQQKEKYGWEFLFLGANIDAAAEAKRFGISADRAVNYKCDEEIEFDVSKLQVDKINLLIRKHYIRYTVSKIEKIRSLAKDSFGVYCKEYIDDFVNDLPSISLNESEIVMLLNDATIDRKYKPGILKKISASSMTENLAKTIANNQFNVDKGYVEYAWKNLDKAGRHMLLVNHLQVYNIAEISRLLTDLGGEWSKLSDNKFRHKEEISIDVNGHNERLLLQLQKKGFITSYQEKNDRKKRCFEVWVKQQ